MADIDDLKKQIEDLNRRVASLGGEFFKDIDQAIASFGGGVKGAEAALKSLNKEMNSLNTDVNYFYETLKKVTKELSGQTNFNKDIAKTYTKLSSIANQLKYDQDGISKLSQKDLISIGKKLEIEKKSLETSIENNKNRKNEIASILKSKSERDKLNENQLRALRKEYEQIRETNKEAEAFYTNPEFGIEALIKANAKRLKQEKEIAANLGLMGAAFKGISNTLQKMGVDSEVIKEMSEDLERAAESGKVGF
jgi:chromosome segregation ATPase